MYIKNLIQQIKTWNVVNKALKEEDIRESILENGFRIDWVGRLYTVIHIPEEVERSPRQIQELYVLSTLRNFDKLFLNIGIADLISPEFKQIDDTNYLLVICPDYDAFKWWKLLLLFISVSAIITCPFIFL